MRIAIGVAALLGAVVITTGADPARADDNRLFASSSPAAGSVVRGAPPVVTLQMTDALDRVTATVTDGCGQPVPNTAEVYGKRVAIRLAVSHIAAGNHGDHTAAGGPWRLAWRAVDPNGSTTSGDLPFTVGVAADCTPPPAVAATASQPPAQHPEFLRILYAIAGLGVLLTVVRVVSRRRAT